MMAISSHAMVVSAFVFFGVVSLQAAAEREGSAPVDVHVGVVLSEEGDRASISCMHMAVSDFYSQHGSFSTRLVLHLRNATGVIPAAAGSLELIAMGAQAIIGPTTSMQAEFVTNMGEISHVPVVSFSASDPSLTSVRSPYFFRATQNDATQTRAVSALMKAFYWGEAVPIYIDNQFGQGILHSLADALVEISARIPYRCPIPPEATDDLIRAELLSLTSMSTRVFVVHMSPDLGQRVFSMAKRLGMMSEEYVWIITDAMADFLHLLDASVIDSMQGVLGVRPYVEDSPLLQNFKSRWTPKFRDDNPSIVDPKLNVYDLWAYDTVTALAMAIEQVGSKHFGNGTGSETRGSPADLENLPVSANGQLLLEAISGVNFTGLSGDFRFVNGELPPAAYQIVNINGSRETTIGFWNWESGLAKGLPMNSSKYVTSSSSLSSIRWPGDPKSVPKGWVLPMKGKKLRIVIPVKEEDNIFVKIKRDPAKNATSFTGFSIDVFKEVVRNLPYDLPYDFIPFASPNGSSNGTYDDMITQVGLGNYDAAVGDITIVAYRSYYVDFTMPYTDSGVSLIVRSSYGRTHNPKIFLRPFSNQLWLTILCSFLFIAIVVWLLERKFNAYFAGTIAQQIGSPLWYSFSTMVAAHGDHIRSNYTRIVVVVWSFVVIILTQSYTASLASLLTVQQLQPMTADARELIWKYKPVGYSKASFVHRMLLRLGFQDSNLIPYNSLDECHELFSNGTIVAAFDETPYLKAFLAKHCNLYTSKHAFETAGFGFVFPIGSPLTIGVSRAVLKVVTDAYGATTNDSFNTIVNQWFVPVGNCSDDTARIASTTLDLSSFISLFIAVLGTSFLAVVISSAWNNYHRVGMRPRVGEEAAMNLDFDPQLIVHGNQQT